MVEQYSSSYQWLREKSVGCLKGETIDRLLRALEVCEEDTEVVIGNLKLLVPCSQVLGAWANIIHIFCLNDYEIGRRVSIGKGDTVVDIGAYLGFFATYTAMLVKPSGRVIAVEPNHFAREYIYRNASLNSLEEFIEVDPRLLWIRDDDIKELIVKENWAQSTTKPTYAEEIPTYRVLTTRTTTLHTLLQSHKIARIDLLKIDVEGSEEEILERAYTSNLLSPKKIRQVVIEVHPSIADSSYIETLLLERGYRVYRKKFGEEWDQEVLIGTPCS